MSLRRPPDTFTYDPAGRMNKYQYNVSAQSVIGTPTWNPNGTLGRLVITDPFNSSNAQTCNYTHDDLARIASANCGSIWSQTFSYDSFGNINKSGNSSFGATYSPATNRMTTIGTSTPSYDANGNVLNDFLHTYTWNADGRPLTIDGIGATYDALGRMVELNRSGTYTEIAYTPSGAKLAVMSGQSLLRAFVPLPAGATAAYTGSGLDHYRHADWLGSARLATTPSRTVYGDVAYAPYGETYAASGNNDFSWTGINADVESANPETLYDFPAREYGIQGRWPSPDPAGIAAVDSSDPQSWNRYAYVLNTPLNAVDPTGMDCQWVNGGAVCTVTDPNPDPGGGGWGGGGGCGEGIGFGGGCGGGPSKDQTGTFRWCVEQLRSDGERNWSELQEFCGGWPGAPAKPKATAPKTPWYNTCTAKAIGNGLLHAGVDSIGLIPEGWLVSRAVGNAFNYRGIVADQFGNKVLGAVQMATGISSTGLGANNTTRMGSISTGLGVAGVVSTLAGATPVFGQVFSGLAVTADLINMGMTIAKCN